MVLKSAVPVIITLCNVHSLGKGRLQERVSSLCLASNMLIPCCALCLPFFSKLQQLLSACDLKQLVCSRLMHVVFCGSAYCRSQAVGVMESSLCGIPAAMQVFCISSLFRVWNNMNTWSILWKAKYRMDTNFISNYGLFLKVSSFPLEFLSSLIIYVLPTFVLLY